MKAGKNPATGCVFLRELSDKEAKELAEAANEPCWCSIPDNLFLPSTNDEDIEDEISEQHNNDCLDDEDIDSITTTQENPDLNPNQDKHNTFFCENEKKTIGIAFEAVRDIPSDLMPETYSILNILQKTKMPPLIVWETARPLTQQILHSPREDEPPLTKDQIIQELKQNLDTVHEFSEDHDFWDQLKTMPNSDIELFYQKLLDAFETANQYIASYSPPLSYCTGAHNNAVLLGGDQQAKAATFYLCPYMGKLKFPLQDCLVILQEAIIKVKQKESIAKDSGTDMRTTKHVLQKCINSLNMHMELSGKLLWHPNDEQWPLLF